MLQRYCSGVALYDTSLKISIPNPCSNARSGSTCSSTEIGVGRCEKHTAAVQRVLRAQRPATNGGGPKDVIILGRHMLKASGYFRSTPREVHLCGGSATTRLSPPCRCISNGTPHVVVVSEIVRFHSSRFLVLAVRVTGKSTLVLSRASKGLQPSPSRTDGPAGARSTYLSLRTLLWREKEGRTPSIWEEIFLD